MPVKVAVIGAGALGLMAMKTFKEDGFDVTGYETRDYVGGLWKDSHDSTISVHATTIFNTSKFRAAMSDFPFQEDADDFPTAAQLHRYLTSYADHFGISKLVQLSTRVKSIKREGSRWALEVESNKTGQSRTDYFDKVCVATGSFYTPRWPKIEGIDTFKGKVMHSIEFHGPEPFKDENVLLVGMHATAQDVTNALSKSAKHVYLAHRSGLLLLPRFADDGSAYDLMTGLRFIFFQAFMSKWCPSVFNWVFDTLATKMSQKSYPNLKKSWNFLPAPSLAVSTPLIGDILYPLMESGFAEPVSPVKQIRGKEVELTDGRILSDVDSIIYCTGYYFNIPDALVPQVPAPTSAADYEADRTGKLETYNPYPHGAASLGEPPRLYRNLFPLHPDPAIRNSIAFVGQSGVPYPGFIQFEMCSMAISQTWLGKSPLPPHKEMLAWYENQKKWRQTVTKQYKPNPNATFYSAFLSFPDHFPWLDNAAGTGIFSNLYNRWFNWRSWKLWLTDREAYDLAMNGVCTAAVFRLFDTGKRKAMDRQEWKKMVKQENERVKRCAERRLKMMEEEKRKKENTNGAHLNGSAKKTV